MANTDNTCSHLQINKDIFDQFDMIFKMQKDIQEKIYGYNFSKFTLKDVVSFWLMNKHAEDDETNEMFDALGGIHDGIGNAVWKPWKKDNRITAALGIEDLSDKDRQELLMEIVDKFHFFMNFAVSVGFTGSDIANAYITKNKENVRRQQEGY